MIPIVFLTAASLSVIGGACEWAPDLSGGPLDVTFYVTSDSEIGRGRPVEEYIRYQRELVNFARSGAVWPEGFRSAGEPIAEPVGVVTTGDNIYGGPGGEGPFIWLIQRLRFEWLWSRSRHVPPLDVFVDPTILDVEPIPYPVYAGLGNHDWDVGSLQGGEATLLRYNRRVMPGCFGVTSFHEPSGNYSWNWGRLHLVQLNEWAGRRDPSGLDWLRNDLERVGPEAPVLLFQHYGFDAFSRQPQWWTSADRSAFLDLVCDYNVLGVVSGHTHHAFPAEATPVSCPAGKKLAGLRNFIGEDGILFNFDGVNGYFGDPPQGTGTFMVFRVVDDGTAEGSFMDAATVSWRRDAATGVEIRGARNGYDFVQTFPIDVEAPSSFRNLGVGAWQHLGGRLRSSPVPVALTDGRLAFFAVFSDGSVRLREEGSTGQLSKWMRLPGTRALSLGAVRPPGGEGPLVVSLTPAGAVEAALRRSDGSVSPWERVGTRDDVFVSGPAIAALSDGSVEVDAVVAGGVLYRTRFRDESGWEPWEALGGPIAGAGIGGEPALVATAEGRLAVVVRGSDGFAYLDRQLVERGAWSGWSRVGTRSISTDVAAVAAGSSLDVFARDAVTGGVWAASGDVESEDFVETVLDGVKVLDAAPAAVLDGTGELRLVVLGAGRNLYENRRLLAEPWAGWNALPRERVRLRPALLALPDGRVEIAATASRGRELLRAKELASWAPAP